MQLSSPHAKDDPAPSRSRCPPPQAEGARGPGGSVPVRLPSPGGPPRRRATDAGRAPVSARAAHASCHSCPTGQGRESGAGTNVIVVDASALLEVLLNTPAGQRIGDRLSAAGETLHAPHLVDLEVAQVLRRYTASGEMDAQRGLQALEDLGDLPLVRYPHDLFLSRIWDLRDNLTAYDAAYVALAEALAAPLVTRDAALASRGAHRARVELM